jgi:D-tyrosyl-tRNA(Tyr) deacylase
MRAVVQRVTRASVTIEGTVAGAIGIGFLVLVGVAVDDTPDDAEQLATKVVNLRIFDDAEVGMTHDLATVGGAILLVSQFTLLADTRRGRRPSFLDAARGDAAKSLYEAVASHMRAAGVHVETGVFGGDMDVELVNHGPVTILLDTQSQAGSAAKG